MLVSATNNDGLYRIPSLHPGHYVISVRKTGFKTVSVTHLDVNVQDNVVRNFVLQVGSSAESVTVMAEGQKIDTTDATVSTVVDRNFAENLPMNGRSFQTLIELTPGVVVTPSNPSDGGQFSVNGQRANANYWTVDGVSANIGASANGLAGNGLAGSLPAFSVQGGTNSLVSVDAMQEFRIQTSSYAPEFGRTPGAQISYDDSNSFPSVTTSNSANSLVIKTTFDGRGRTLTQQALNGTSPVSIRSFGYDAVGQLNQASNPYSSGTPLYTKYHYDAFGRVDSVTPPALITGGTQNAYGTSYSLATVTFTDPAGKQRKQYKDALGRLVRVDEPGLIGGQSASASGTISGAEQSVSVPNGNGATAGTASISFGGTTDRSTVVLTHAATAASVQVTIGGSNAKNSNTFCGVNGCRTTTIQDTGTISFTVIIGGVTVGPVSTTYGGGSTQTNLASALYNNFPSNSLVAVSNLNGNSFIVTTAAKGNSTNSSTISTSLVTNCTDSGNVACGGPGWTMGLSSSPNFAGGSDNVWTTFYDTGTASLTITANGTNYSKTSSHGQSSTPTSIVTDLANQINADTTLNKLIIAAPPEMYCS
jgi:uncharacterized protein